MTPGLGFTFNMNPANACYPLSIMTGTKYDLAAVDLDNMVMDSALAQAYAEASFIVQQNHRMRTDAMSCMFGGLGGAFPVGGGAGNGAGVGNKEGTESERKLFEKKRDFIIAYCNFNNNDRKGEIRDALDEIIAENSDYESCIEAMDELIEDKMEESKIKKFMNSLSRQAMRNTGAGKAAATKLAEAISNINSDATKGMFDAICDVIDLAGKDNILDLISEWNDSNEDSILKALEDKLADVKGIDGNYTDGTRRNRKLSEEGKKVLDEYKEKIIKKLGNLLLEKAEDFESELEEIDKTSLYDDLKSELKKNDIDVNKVSSLVNDLYKELRLLEANEYDSAVEDTYWDVLPEGMDIDVDAAMEDTKEDLESEGFGIG